MQSASQATLHPTGLFTLRCLRSKRLSTRSAKLDTLRVARTKFSGKSAAQVVFASSDEPKYEVVYFDARGAAETSRTILAIAGADYKDSRYQIRFESGKPIVEEAHGRDKNGGRFAGNLNRLPLLRLADGTVVGQSKAMERFLAREFGLMGSSPVEEALVDAYCEHLRDLTTAFGKVRGSPFGPMSDETKAVLDEWYAEGLPTWLQSIEAVTGEGGHAVGSSTTLADVCLYQVVTEGRVTGAKDAKEAIQFVECLGTVPKIVKVLHTVGALENLKKWKENRPVTMF